jgi:hypothetical protein
MHHACAARIAALTARAPSSRDGVREAREKGSSLFAHARPWGKIAGAATAPPTSMAA